MPHVELPQAELKVVVIGDTSIGKTSLILRFVEGYYRNENSPNAPAPPRSPTVHASFYSKNLLLPTAGVTTKIQIWDTAGQALHRKMNRMYYSSAAAVMVCFDARKRDTFRVAQEMVEEVYSVLPVGEIFVALVSTKSDLEYESLSSSGMEVPEGQTTKTVSELEARQYAHSIGAIYVATSAKDNDNVTYIFSKVAEGVLRQREQARLNASMESSSGPGGISANQGGSDMRNCGSKQMYETKLQGMAMNSGGGVNTDGIATGANPSDDSLDDIKLDRGSGTGDPLNEPSLKRGLCMGPLCGMFID